MFVGEYFAQTCDRNRQEAMLKKCLCDKRERDETDERIIIIIVTIIIIAMVIINIKLH